MDHDHRYVRQLLQLREAPRLPVLWLLVPWAVATVWSGNLTRSLLPVELPPHPAGAFVVATVAARFVELGGIGAVVSWTWLYVAWPAHPRVLCWGALAGVIALWVWPLALTPVAPLFVSLCMVGAILEQAIARRRSRVREALVAPAV